MALSKVTLKFRTGGLALAAGRTEGLFAVLGRAWSGDAAAPVRVRDDKVVFDDFVGGDLVDAVADAFVAGGRDCYACKVAADTAGTTNAAQADAGNTGGGALAAAGDPTDAFDIAVEILSAGDLNEATFRVTVSQQGKAYITKEATVPAGGTYLIPNTGVTLTFSVADPEDPYDAGDAWTITTTAPTSTLTAVEAAIDAVLAQPQRPEFILLAGPSSSALWVGLGAKRDELRTAGIFIFFIAEAAGNVGVGDTADIATWIGTLTTARAAVDDYGVAVVAGRAMVTDQVHGELERNVAGLLAGRLASIAVNRSAGRVRDGALRGAVSLAPAAITEANIESIDALGFAGVRAYNGKSGLYVTRAHTLSDTDFNKVERMRVLCKAARQVYALAIDELQDDFQVDADATGIQAIEERLVRPIRLMTGAGECSGGDVRVLTTIADLLSTEELSVLIEITPNGMVNSLSITIGFANPFIES